VYNLDHNIINVDFYIFSFRPNFGWEFIAMVVDDALNDTLT